jgi:hypothetical protein
MVAPLEVDVTGWFIRQLGARLTGVRVLAETPAKIEAHLPVVRIVGLGGPDDGLVIDSPSVAFHCFAADQAAANALALRTSTAIRALRGVPVDGAVVIFTQKRGGPTPNFHDNPAIREAVVIHQISIKTTF